MKACPAFGFDGGIRTSIGSTAPQSLYGLTDASQHLGVIPDSVLSSGMR